jgi:hypothetical protein
MSPLRFVKVELEVRNLNGLDDDAVSDNSTEAVTVVVSDGEEDGDEVQESRWQQEARQQQQLDGAGNLAEQQDVEMEEEIELHIVREPGAGLGLTIIGGAGSESGQPREQVRFLLVVTGL